MPSSRRRIGAGCSSATGSTRRCIRSAAIWERGPTAGASIRWPSAWPPRSSTCPTDVAPGGPQARAVEELLAACVDRIVVPPRGGTGGPVAARLAGHATSANGTRSRMRGDRARRPRHRVLEQRLGPSKTRNRSAQRPADGVARPGRRLGQHRDRRAGSDRPGLPLPRDLDRIRRGCARLCDPQRQRQDGVQRGQPRDLAGDPAGGLGPGAARAGGPEPGHGHVQARGSRLLPAPALRQAGARRGRPPVPRRVLQCRSRPGAQLRLDQRPLLGVAVGPRPCGPGRAGRRRGRSRGCGQHGLAASPLAPA